MNKRMLTSITILLLLIIIISNCNTVMNSKSQDYLMKLDELQFVYYEPTNSLQLIDNYNTNIYVSNKLLYKYEIPNYGFVPRFSDLEYKLDTIFMNKPNCIKIN